MLFAYLRAQTVAWGCEESMGLPLQDYDSHGPARLLKHAGDGGLEMFDPRYFDKSGVAGMPDLSYAQVLWSSVERRLREITKTPRRSASASHFLIQFPFLHSI